jgi:hypothetical protein
VVERLIFCHGLINEINVGIIMKERKEKFLCYNIVKNNQFTIGTDTEKH